VSKDKVFQPWLKKKGIEDVEAFVPDMAGSARGKVVPADKFGIRRGRDENAGGHLFADDFG
jgi:glutamine synthetase